jgi:uncharacterized membrane protein YqjE
VNPDDDTLPPGPIRRLIASLSGLLATAIGIGRTRLELLSVELREELNRTAGLILWGAIGVLAAGAAVLFAGLGVIFAFWDSHRILAAVGVTGAFALLAGIAGLVIRARLRTRPPFLHATLGELARDEGELRGRSQ